jgi:hypothetical protein
MTTILAISVIAGNIWTFLFLGIRPLRVSAFEQNNFHFNIYRNELLPDVLLVMTVYSAYVILNRKIIVPYLENLKSSRATSWRSRFPRLYWQLSSLIVLVGSVVYLALYFKHEWAALTLRNLWGCYLGALLGLMVALLYLAIREGVIFAIERSGSRMPYWTLVCNQLTAFLSIYITIPFVSAALRLVHEGSMIDLYFAVLLPFFLVYMANTYWIFPLQGDRKLFNIPTVLRIIVTTGISSLPFFLAPFHEGLEFGFLGCWLVHLFVTTPITWILYQGRRDKILQLRGAETALSKSTMDLQLLRSQINPHFLFNTLNTLYGFAIRENAALTSGGIQTLGDMMRFMLEENTKDSIPISREAEYLQNYIRLQKMRIDDTLDIRVEEKIDLACRDQEIAPMLLIPFVENAFKHGVSLDHPSWIKIDLNCDKKKIVFEVRNSLHPGAGNDPEKNRGGIGNNNVLTRLKLIYPSRHQIFLTTTDTEYIVRLTLHF